MQSIGIGVFELQDSDESAWYRMLYVARKRTLYLCLIAFKKTLERQRSTA